MNMWEMILIGAAVLAIVLSALFIGACLLISWMTDAVRGRSRQERHEEHGYVGAPSAQPFRPDGRHRNTSGPPPVGSWHGGR